MKGRGDRPVRVGERIREELSLLLLRKVNDPGLAPVTVSSIFTNLAAINRDGVTILLVEQNVLRALRLSHRAYVLENGTIALEGASQRLLADEGIKRAYFGR